MPTNLISKGVIKELAAKAAGLDNDRGNERLKQVVNRLLNDLMIAVDELDISMDEFWAGVAYIGEASKANELGLIVPGVALEHFLDLRLDEAERRAGLSGGTTRTIEGPLYVAGAPLSKGEARLDDGTDDGEILLWRAGCSTPPASRSRVQSLMSGMPIPSASTRSLARRNPPTICVVGLRSTVTAATVSAPSCRPAMAARPDQTPRHCWRKWAATANGRRTSTSSSPRRATVSSPRRSTLMATSTCTMTLPSARATT